MVGVERDRELTRHVAQYIEQQALLVPQEHVTVALSGGADSVCLLHVLQELGYSLQAAHCNFHLRGEESNRDQHFVEHLCKKIGVPLFVRDFDTYTEARSTKQSIEMAARNLRYQWFATLGTTIAVAHHSDDNAETLLLNLVRGTGLRGLGGIQPKSNMYGTKIVRPLLSINRRQINGYLKRRGLSYVIDSTNLETIARRNIIRLHVLPLMSQLNPSIGDTLSEEAVRCSEALRLLDESLNRYARLVQDGDTIIISELERCPAPLALLHHLLSPYGFNSATIKNIYAQRYGQDGSIYISSTHRLLRHDGRFILQAVNSVTQQWISTLDAGQTITLPDGRTIKAELINAIVPISRNPNIVTLDAGQLHFPLIIRSIQRGDRFHPYGMKGTKLVSDFLAGCQINVFERQKQLVVLSGNDIVWVVGLRTAQSAAITACTRAVLMLTLSESEA